METDTNMLGDDTEVRQVWRCDAPEIGVQFQVLDDHWDLQSQPVVRCIHEVRVVG